MKTSGPNRLCSFQIPGTELSIRANFGLVNGVSLAMLGYLPLVPFDGVVGIVNDAEGGFVRSLGRRLKDKIVSVWTARYATSARRHTALFIKPLYEGLIRRIQ